MSEARTVFYYYTFPSLGARCARRDVSMKKVVFLLTILLCQTAFSQETPQRQLGDLWWEPITTTMHGVEVTIDRGHLMVRENRIKATSGLVELVFVRMKSTATKPGYPVIYLDGGPGSSPLNLAQVKEYFDAFQKLREVGDVILLDQRGVGRSRPMLTQISTESMPLNIFSDREAANREFARRFKAAADFFRAQGVDLTGYNSRESAHDVDDIRKALGAEKVNLVGFSYGTHLTFACLRYHSTTIERAVVFGSEGPDHTEKLPMTSDASLRRLAKLAAADPEIARHAPDIYATLKRVMEKFAKEPAKVTINDRRGNKPVEITISDYGLRYLIMRDLGDTNDLPIFPAWFVTMDRGDYSILKQFAERRYNQLGQGVPVMTLMVDSASGASKARRAQIEREAKRSIMGDMVNFFQFNVPGVTDTGIDLGDEYRSPLRTSVPTLFVSGDRDNNTPPFQADEIRRTFRTSTHIIIGNAGHESTFTQPEVQQIAVDYLLGKDVSKATFSLPPLKFRPIPDEKKQ